jgi:hypothetical protein
MTFLDAIRILHTPFDGGASEAAYVRAETERLNSETNSQDTAAAIRDEIGAGGENYRD